jgi:hypothetical protein
VDSPALPRIRTEIENRQLHCRGMPFVKLV